VKEALIAYLVAAGLNLALLWREMDLPVGGAALPNRPALVRVFDGATVAATRHDHGGCAVGLLVDQRLHLNFGDAKASLFPGTALLVRLEAPISVLN
jgi:hypothetical protein